MPDIASGRGAGGSREAALATLGAWRGGEGGKRPEDLLREASQVFGLDRRDRALALELAYGVIRNLTHLDYILSFYIKTGPQGLSEPLRDVLRLAVYQIKYLDKVPERAAVNEAVEQAKLLGGPKAGGFANGILRTLLREPGRVTYPAGEAGLSIVNSYPSWLVARWVARLGNDGAEALMKAGNGHPPVTLRANTLLTTRDRLLELLLADGVEAAPGRYAPDSINVRGRGVAELPGFADGLFAVQDEAAQLVSMMLAPMPGWTVLDACAAPGGKSAHISALSGGLARVIAMDIGLDKLRLMKENISRLRLGNVYPVMGDASYPPVKGPVDAVLIDAPCTALGVIRRRPEIKYNRTGADLSRLAWMQRGLLDAVSGLVRPGGVMVYAVCSTEPDEGEDVVSAFLTDNKGFVAEDAGKYLPVAAHCFVNEEGFMRSYPHLHGTDGFFAARLIKK